MTPTMLALIFSLIEEAIKIEPALLEELQALFQKTDPTPADWEALRQVILSDNYRAFVPDSDLSAANPDPAAAQTPAVASPPPIPAGTSPEVAAEFAGLQKQ